MQWEVILKEDVVGYVKRSRLSNLWGDRVMEVITDRIDR